MSLKDKTIIRQWQFRSSTNPGIIYSTLMYNDGSASCNSPAWTRRVAKDGSRSCKHLISAGISPISISVPAGKAAPKAGQSLKHGQPATLTMRVVRAFNFED